jgi:cytochrome P450
MTTSSPETTWLPSERFTDRPYDPPEELARRRDQEPLSRINYAGEQTGWLVTSHALGRAVLADPRFGVRAELIGNPIRGATVPDKPAAAPPGFMTRSDPPEHTRYRRNLVGQFTVRRMRQLTARIQEVTDEHLESLRRLGPPADLVANFARPIPALTVCEVLGVSDSARDAFQEQVAAMRKPDASMQELTSAFVAVHGFLRDLVVAKRKDPAADVLSGLTATDLTDEELTNLAFTILAAGLDTTANMLAVGTLALLRCPDQAALLRDQPELTENAVEELLRYLAIIPISVRVALADVELHGRTIKAGESVTISLAAANRDPSQYADPDRLDLRRSARSHMTFGHGIHQCLAQQLARVQMQVAFPALLRAFPTLRLAVEPADVPLRDEIALYGVHELPVSWT